MRNEWQPFTKIDGRIVELIIIYIAQVLDQEETDLSQNVSKASRRKTDCCILSQSGKQVFVDVP